MSGLLLKDALNQKQQIKIQAAIAILWFIVAMWNGSPGFFGSIMVMFVVIIPMNAIAYDDNSRWNSFALTAPITRTQLVLSKYILMLIVLVLTMIVAFAGEMALGSGAEISLITAAVLFPIGIVIASALFPIIFKFGMEKGRFVFIGFIIIALVVLGFGKSGITGAAADGFIREVLADAGEVTLAVIVFVFTIAVGTASFLISKKIYDKKEF